MKLPAEVKAIRARWIAAKGLPEIRDGENDESWTRRLRSWTVEFCEQVAFDLPGQGWGVKRGDSGRPIGKDTIARQIGDRLLAWDLLTAASGGHPRVNDDPDSMEIGPGTPDGGPDGQFFETRPEFFAPKNHLGGAQPQQPSQPGQPEQPPAPVDQTFEHDVRESLGRVELAIKALALAVNNNPFPVPPPLDIAFPNYEGETVLPLPTFLGGSRPVKVVLKPKENA